MASPEFRIFELQLKREMQEQFIEHIGVITRKIALQGLQGVVRKSPVDTGLFRSNWMVDAGALQAQTQEKIETAGATVSRGIGKIAAAREFEPITLHNSLPYAERLENGWSKQAPAGIVSVTAAELESQFRRVK